MTPWAAEPATRREAAYEGGAPAFLTELLNEVLPAAEADLAGAGLGVAGEVLPATRSRGSLPCGARGRPTRSCAWRARRVPYGTRAGSALRGVRSPSPGPNAHISLWGARSTRRPTDSCATFARLRSRRGTFFAPTVSSAPSSSTPATTSRTPTCAWPAESGGFWTRPAGMRGSRGRLLRALVRRSEGKSLTRRGLLCSPSHSLPSFGGVRHCTLTKTRPKGPQAQTRKALHAQHRAL